MRARSFKDGRWADASIEHAIGTGLELSRVFNGAFFILAIAIVVAESERYRPSIIKMKAEPIKLSQFVQNTAYIKLNVPAYRNTEISRRCG